MTTTYTFEQLKEDVRKEAEALRVHATAKELAWLDIEMLNPKGRHSCIYGMATGDCHSDRAIHLIKKCCVRYFRNEIFTDIINEGFEDIKQRVNGTKCWFFRRDRKLTNPKHYSAIEAYILLPEARNANLIAFLMELSGCIAWIEGDSDNYKEGDEMPEYTITPVWMTDEEFNNLPEHD